MGTVIFIVVRWSHHFASIYTNQFLPNTTSYATTAFPFLHLLPIDSSTTDSFNDLVINYQQQILAPTVMSLFSEQVSFQSCRDFQTIWRWSFQVVFLLSELENVEFFGQNLPSNFTSTTWTTTLGSITFDSTSQRSFIYSFVGRQCNGTWSILKIFNSTWINVDGSSTACINYPSGDVTATDDSGKSRKNVKQRDQEKESVCVNLGWRILRIVLFSLLGVLVACVAALIAFMVVR